MTRRGRQIRRILLAGAASGLLLACTEAPQIETASDDGPVTMGSRDSRCGNGSIACGGEDGCCAAGNICTVDSRCSPSTGCTTSRDCSADSVCAGGRCVPWSAYPAETNFDPDCDNGVDETGATLSLPDLTVSADPVFTCEVAQPRAQISVSLCNRGLLEVAPGQASVALVDAAEPANSLCEHTNANVLRPGACETLSCKADVPFTNSGFDIAVLADPSGEVAECTEGENNRALITNVYCERLPPR